MPEDEFYREKRPWSRVKDGILSYYIEPYLNIIQARRKPILIVDTFAGPGRFDDGEIGSPLIIAQTCQRLVPTRHTAEFANIEEDQHNELEANLAAYPNASALPMRARQVLERLKKQVRDESLFLYLDPYGLEDCDYDLVKPLLDRTVRGDYSTELLLVFQMSSLHRQAARGRVLEEYNALLEQWDNNPAIPKPTFDQAIAQLASEQQNKVSNIDRVMGGTYWREIEYSGADESVRAERLVQAYMDKLSSPDKFAMSCPVNVDYEGTTKYHIVFVSRHPKAAVLMNEAMVNSTDTFYSFNVEIQESQAPSLFGVEMSPWHQKRNFDRQVLKPLIPEYVARNDPRLNRADVWFKLMSDHFMRFSRSDYRSFVQDLVSEGRLVAVKDGVRVKVARGKRPRLNENTTLYLPDDPIP